MTSFLYNYPFIIIYGITLIVALIYYRKYFETSLKYFPIFILFTLITEILGTSVQSNSNFSFFINEFHIDNNWFLYNIYDLIVCLYLCYIFWVFTNHKLHKKIIKTGAVFYIIISIINPFFQNFLIETQSYSFIFSSLIIVCCTIFYFFYRKSITNLIFDYKDLMSWIALGFFIFYLGFLPIFLHREYNTIYSLHESPLIRDIHYTIIFIMYFIFIIGFIISKKIKTQENT